MVGACSPGDVIASNENVQKNRIILSLVVIFSSRSKIKQIKGRLVRSYYMRAAPATLSFKQSSHEYRDLCKFRGLRCVDFLSEILLTIWAFFNLTF